MAHGTPRRCPVTILPKERTMTRATWEHLDRVTRLIWRKHEQHLGTWHTDLMVYGRALMPRPRPHMEE